MCKILCAYKFSSPLGKCQGAYLPECVFGCVRDLCAVLQSARTVAHSCRPERGSRSSPARGVVRTVGSGSRTPTARRALHIPWLADLQDSGFPVSVCSVLTGPDEGHVSAHGGHTHKCLPVPLPSGTSYFSGDITRGTLPSSSGSPTPSPARPQRLCL